MMLPDGAEACCAHVIRCAVSPTTMWPGAEKFSLFPSEIFLHTERIVSQIAAALARSKGKKVDPVADDGSVVPEIHTTTPPMPVKPQPVKKKSPVKLIAIAGGAVAFLAVGGWLIFRPSPPPAAAAPRKTIVTPVVAKTPSVPVKAPEQPKAIEPSAPLPPPTMSPAVEKQLMELVISARRTGSEQRIVIGKKVFFPGDTVIDGVMLDAVLPDRVVFRDDENRLFERRY